MKGGKSMLDKARDDCGSWDEEFGCMDGYPEECPFNSECRSDAEEKEEE